MSRKLTVLPCKDRKTNEVVKLVLKKRDKERDVQVLPDTATRFGRESGNELQGCVESGENPVIVQICVSGEKLEIIENFILDLAWVHKHYFLPKGLPNIDRRACERKLTGEGIFVLILLKSAELDIKTLHSLLWTRADFQVSYIDGERRRPAPDQVRVWPRFVGSVRPLPVPDMFENVDSEKKLETGLRRGCVRPDPLLHLRCVGDEIETRPRYLNIDSKQSKS
ncbi:hypothetical protein NPIL_503461 [Nephila pilipes]|uniref:Uncharacterized protein n=1 Tax=Nephila pilipes TaxID=299642 RepID=A0A8X6NYW0_NEPPI|nr:hypothetical protein NPIL_503461 [Nephila pilipes]